MHDTPSPVDPSEQPGMLTTEGEIVIRAQNTVVTAVKSINLFISTCLNVMTS